MQITSSAMLQIDNRLTGEQIEQFASQMHGLAPSIKNFMQESFSGGESVEFYKGLASGLAAAYQLSALESGRFFIGAALATTAAEIQANE